MKSLTANIFRNLSYKFKGFLDDFYLFYNTVIRKVTVALPGKQNPTE